MQVHRNWSLIITCHVSHPNLSSLPLLKRTKMSNVAESCFSESWPFEKPRDGTPLSCNKDMLPQKHLIIISGRRRSGKTTFAQKTFPGRPIFWILCLRNTDVQKIPYGSVIEIQQSPTCIPPAWRKHVLKVYILNPLVPYSFLETAFAALTHKSVTFMQNLTFVRDVLKVALKSTPTSN